MAGGEAEGGARELCHEERQAFIDCMFVKSKAVQGGACTIDECLGGGAASGVPEECAALYKAFLRCRRQLVRLGGRRLYSLWRRRRHARG